MGIGVQHKNVRKTALPRTGRTLDAVGGGTSSVSSGASSGGGSSVVEGNFEIIEGKGISVDKQLAGSLVYTISHGSTSEAKNTENKETFVVKNILIDTFGHVTGVESEDMSIIFDGKYLRKDKPDETDYLLGLNGGATFGNYVGGFLGGSGGIINEKGYAELMGLTLREFLEVPELRFNRIDVISGETWNAIAFGLIESVDEANRIVTLKLEDGELSGMHLNDFCRGIFHNLTDNATITGKDGAGFEVMVGFSTSYFTPVEIIDNAHFKYELKPGSTVHPCPFMKFAVYGNPTDKNRQASAYSTRTYKRYLVDVDTWEINPGKHVSMQFGDLSNLVINGESLKKGSVYLNNVYFGGNILTVGGLDNGLKGKDAYSVTLSTYSAVYNTKEDLAEQSDVVTGDKTVMTGSDIVVASSFRITTRIQATKGEKQLRYSTVVGEGKYLVSATGDGCTFTVTDGMIVVHSVTSEKAVIKIDVNCEGIAVYEQEFTIVSVVDGIDGTDIEWIYQRTTTEAAKPAKPASENTDDFVPAGWTDDPVGTTIDLPYEWSCKREKKNGVWGEFSDVFLWLKFGKDGKEIEYIYRRTTGSRPATPGTSQVDDYVPSGWTDDPVGPDASYPYEWVSVRKKVNGVWGSFSLPALSAKYSFDGQDGHDGQDGEKGNQGIQGPGLNYCGDWSSTTTYYKNDHLVDVVSVRDSNDNPTYYILLKSSSRNQYPGSYPSVWQVQNSFKNIATDLLFANDATIAGWRFYNHKIVSLNNQVVLNGNSKLEDAEYGTDTDIVFAAGGDLNPAWKDNKVNRLAGLKIHRGGTITLGNGTSAGRVGMTGSPDMDNIRIWAGKDFSQRNTAPFIVYDNGNMIANNCGLTGSFQTSASGKRLSISINSTYGAMLFMTDANSNSVLKIFGPGASTPAGINVVNGAFTAIMEGHTFAINSSIGSVAIRVDTDGSANIKASKWPTASRAEVGEMYVENGYVKVKTS